MFRVPWGDVRMEELYLYAFEFGGVFLILYQRIFTFFSDWNKILNIMVGNKKELLLLMLLCSCISPRLHLLLWTRLLGATPLPQTSTCTHRIFYKQKTVFVNDIFNYDIFKMLKITLNFPWALTSVRTLGTLVQ